MKIKIYSLIILCFAVFGYSQTMNVKQQRKTLQKQYAKFEKNLKKVHAQKDGIPPNEYNEQDFKFTMNPETGQPEFYKLTALKKDLDAGKYKPQQPLSLLANIGGNTKNIIGEPWTERGPYSVGGRTRAIMFDPNDASGKRVFAGGVSGGLWVNNDVTNASSEWTPLSGMWSNTSISSMAYDPNNPNIFYIGTGECETGDAIGSGIWKSTDAGATWSHIFVIPVTYNGTNRNGNFYINDVVVRNNNGVSEVYAGVSGGNISINFNDGFSGLQQAGLYKSVDGGANFSKINSLVVPESATLGLSIQQIEIAADNALWVSTRTSRYSSGASSGGKIYRSTDGVNFTKIYDANVPTARVRFGLSATNGQKAYALMSIGGAEPVRIIKTSNAGTSWLSTNDSSPAIKLPVDADTGIPANDFTRGQAFYDLVIIPDPANDETVYTGGIDLFKSTDGAGNWTQISKWSNNNNLASLAVSMVHADQHTIAFNPKNSAQMLFGNDGGIFFTANNVVLNNTSAIAMRNTRYNVTQYYGATLNPAKTPANEEFLAGAQDNGTSLFAGAPLANNFYTVSSYYGGDGCHTEYGKTGNYKIFSYVYNYHYITAPNGNNYSLITNNPGNTGYFVNILALDRNRDVFFSTVSGYTLNRVLNVNSNNAYVRSTISAGTPASGEGISKLTVSPYTTTSTTLFAGTTLGKLIKISNADTTPVPTPVSTPFAGTVSDIQFGASEDEILVTISNYGATMVNVYYTSDGGATWQNKEGNLPDMPVRAIFMNPSNPLEVVIGTEMGVWGTADFTAPTPTWAQFSGAIGNTRITKLDYRPATKTLLAATYGRGAWTSTNSTSPLAVNDAAAAKQNFKVYPNPSRGSVYLKFDKVKMGNVDVRLLDASGKLVFTKRNVNSDEEIITGLPKGFYVMQVNHGTEIIYTTPVMIR
ncbi:T9SS type A sorting domain-containing protein [Kaistella palustris]|uniref:T9SS type A sorting domain-containing protein n=1 Tax=Kaistella palustris TaxID=493376 RepID=UPI00041647D5|nr:T9SS type A sorting domain-containing protein [Kaistella palustris]